MPCVCLTLYFVIFEEEVCTFLCTLAGLHVVYWIDRYAIIPIYTVLSCIAKKMTLSYN